MRDVCWNEKVEDPKPGCVAKPTPGTHYVDVSNAGTRIINGQDASIVDHPWAVLLYLGWSLQPRCGGAIIGKHMSEKVFKLSLFQFFNSRAQSRPFSQDLIIRRVKFIFVEYCNSSKKIRGKKTHRMVTDAIENFENTQRKRLNERNSVEVKSAE